MKKRYIIGLFLTILLVCTFLCWSSWDRHKVAEEKLAQKKILLSEEKKTETTSEEEEITDAVQINSGYYIMITEGYVCVYRAEDKCLYFQTNILAEDLPEEVRLELEQGKYMISEIEVYHYLESYSS